jgi:hypothetical protein
MAHQTSVSLAFMSNDEVKSPIMRKPFQPGQDRIPKFYLYKMTVNNGGAPSVQNGLLSLAICKPTIRRVALKGDVIIGFAGNKLVGEGYDDNSIVYAAIVSRKLDGEYYSEKEYAGRPDCIYRRTGKRFAKKVKAMFHTGPDKLEHDLGAPPYYKNAAVLLSEGAKNFMYFGNQCPVQYKNSFPRLRKEIERLRRGHRVNHDPQLYAELLRLKELLWKERSSFSHTPIPGKPDDTCDWDDDAIECDGC